MRTKQSIIFEVVTARFLLETSDDNSILLLKRMGNSQVLDTFHVDEDPMDTVVDEIVMDFIEWCPASIDTDNEILVLTNEVYIVVTMFYALRTQFIVEAAK